MARLLEGKDANQPCYKCEDVDCPPGVIRRYGQMFSLGYTESYCDCYLGQLRRKRDQEKDNENNKD